MLESLKLQNQFALVISFFLTNFYHRYIHKAQISEC